MTKKKTEEVPEEPVVEIPEPEEVPPPAATILDFRRSGPNFDVSILDKLISSGRHDLKPYRDSLDDAVAQIPDDKRSPRFAEFREAYNSRILEMPILKESAQKGDRDGEALEHQGKIRRIINSLPEA